MTYLTDNAFTAYVAIDWADAKNDPTDAELILDLLVRHPERFAPLDPQSVEMHLDDKARITNRVRSTLKQYYPQMLELFKHVDTVMVCDFITRWPTLKQLKRSG